MLKGEAKVQCHVLAIQATLGFEWKPFLRKQARGLIHEVGWGLLKQGRQCRVGFDGSV